MNRTVKISAAAPAWVGDGILFFDANGDNRIGETRDYVSTGKDPAAAAAARAASFKVMVSKAGAAFPCAFDADVPNSRSQLFTALCKSVLTQSLHHV